MSKKIIIPEISLVCDIRALIHDARSAVAIAVNSGVTMLYWRIGSWVGCATFSRCARGVSTMEK